jgi:poly(hydroxyalkanoate) granule-associated protein
MSKPKLKSKVVKSKTAAAAKPAKLSKPAKLAKPSHPSKLPVANKSIMESAQHIWLAGLGAFAKAQEEGGRLFETLIKEGSNLEQKTRKLATGKVGDVRGAVESSVSLVRERTQETWDRLEQVFESRVSRALTKLGIPGRKELDELLQRVDELNREVKKLTGTTPKSTLSRVMGNTVRRARDDLSDLARELEEAQLAAKKLVTRTVTKVKKTIKGASR